ncbi:MAG: DUF5655 domain-containing protein [Clostridia bacterium]|nr:DUF5655 domain-containing protein [Clostridia bacterium]
MLFFDRAPRLLPVYAALRAALTARYPEMRVRVAKTQISFLNRRIFAMVSILPRRTKGGPENGLRLSFGLPYRQVSPRIAQAAEPYPNRWTHHVIVESVSELDAELLGWIGEAFAFAMVK